MKNLRLLFEFGSDDGEKTWQCVESIDALDDRSFELAMRTFECAYRRVVDEQTAIIKKRIAQQHRDRNASQ